jgi:O-antigen/teichoic acid export membrane protein
VALGLFDGDRAAGLYSAPQRVVLFLTTMSSMFGAALYPRLAALRAEGRQAFERVVQRGFRVMILAGVPIGVGGALVAVPLIAFIYGPGYEEGAAVFRWLVPSVVLISANAPFGYALLAAGAQRPYFHAAVAGAAVNVVVNLALIPRLHLLGPAVATLCAEGLVLVMLVIYTRPIAKVEARRIVLTAAISAAAMAGSVFFVRSAPFPAQILVGAVVYTAGLAALRGVSRADLMLLRDMAGLLTRPSRHPRE